MSQDQRDAFVAGIREAFVGPAWPVDWVTESERRADKRYPDAPPPASADGMLDRRTIEKLLFARDALIKSGDVDEAYHQIYSIADPTFSKTEPWAEWEKVVEASEGGKG
jgi:hypothetical protein